MSVSVASSPIPSQSLREMPKKPRVELVEQVHPWDRMVRTSSCHTDSFSEQVG